MNLKLLSHSLSYPRGGPSLVEGIAFVHLAIAINGHDFEVNSVADLVALVANELPDSSIPVFLMRKQLRVGRI